MQIELQNLGTINKNKIIIGNLTLWFSYETVVAFNHPQTGFVCRENSWSVTTGKFLNELEPDHKARMKSEEFEKLLEKFEVGVIAYPNMEAQHATA